MNENEIDARNRQCPAPVLMTREIIENRRPGTIRVIVDNDASRQNVGRFLRSMAYTVVDEPVGDDFHITGTRAGDEEAPAEDVRPGAGGYRDAQKIMVMITTDRMGYGDDELGRKLMANYIRTLNEFGRDLWRLVFVNNGVRLTVESAEVLDTLAALEKNGLQILVCGTCLEHYGLTPQKRAGETTNMLDIITAMHLADKVITL